MATLTQSSYRRMKVTQIGPCVGLCLMIVTTVPALAVECPAQPYPAQVTQSPSVELREPPNVGELKLRALNYKCFGQYDADVKAVLKSAQDYIESYVAPVTDKPSKLAIVLDIDETVLSNWPAILADDFGYIKKGTRALIKDEACGWIEWQNVEHKDEPIIPAIDLFNAAKAKGIAVFFVTGRARTPAQLRKKISTPPALRTGLS